MRYTMYNGRDHFVDIAPRDPRTIFERDQLYTVLGVYGDMQSLREKWGARNRIILIHKAVVNARR